MKSFRLISLIEGISLLVLLFIAMPLKYKWGINEAVWYAGITHGTLFLIYLVMSLVTSHQQQWPVIKWLLIFLAGVFPFGFIMVDRKLKKEMA
jgi:integral membrane protein